MDEKQPLLETADRNVVILGGKKIARRILGNRIVGAAVFHPSDTAEGNVVLGEEGTGKRNRVAGAAVFHPSDNAERNVVILGKEGTGKRTLGNRMVGRDIFQPGRRSDTKCDYREWQIRNMFCRILIVHTESLQTDHLTQYIRQHFERIHLVIFVIPKGRYHPEIKVARYPAFSRSTNLESKLIVFFVLLKF